MMQAVGILIGGKRSARVFGKTVDFDAKSLYPRIMLATNNDSTGQIGRIILIMPDGTEVDSAELMEAWITGDMMEVGCQWFDLPNLYELMDILEAGEAPVDAPLALT